MEARGCWGCCSSCINDVQGPISNGPWGPFRLVLNGLRFLRAFDQHMTSMHIFFCKFCITVVDFGKKREILLDFLIKKSSLRSPKKCRILHKRNMNEMMHEESLTWRCDSLKNYSPSRELIKHRFIITYFSTKSTIFYPQDARKNFAEFWCDFWAFFFRIHGSLEDLLHDDDAWVIIQTHSYEENFLGYPFGVVPEDEV